MSSGFPDDFLRRFPAFRGELEYGDRRIGEQWLQVWEAAHASARESLYLRASIERKAGRIEVADAIEASATSLDVVDPSAY